MQADPYHNSSNIDAVRALIIIGFKLLIIHEDHHLKDRGTGCVQSKAKKTDLEPAGQFVVDSTLPDEIDSNDNSDKQGYVGQNTQNVTGDYRDGPYFFKPIDLPLIV